MKDNATAELDKLRRLLREVDIDEDDEEALRILIEGETNIPEIGAHIIEAINEVTALASGAKEAEHRLKQRRERLETKAEALKDRLFAIASKLNTSCQTPVGTFGTRVYSTTKYDEGMIPDRFRVTPPPNLNRPAIKAAIKAGENVPGVDVVQSKTLFLKV